jgi:hypothetical protein
MNPKKKRTRLHIVLRHDLSAACAVVAAAHAALGTYLTFKDDTLMQEWEKTSFVKIIHKALNEHQFKACRDFGPNRVFTESSLGGIEVSVGFKPMEIDHPWFADIPLWKLET